MNREEYLNLLLQTNKQGNKPKDKQTGKPSKYPQGYFKDKACRICNKTFKPKAPSEHYCDDYCKTYSEIEKYYIRNYGITIDTYLDMAEKQNFVCAICDKENFAMGTIHSGLLVVDHCHTTGKVRGLLCHNCNRALGLFQDDKDNLKKAIAYL